MDEIYNVSKYSKVVCTVSNVGATEIHCGCFWPYQLCSWSSCRLWSQYGCIYSKLRNSHDLVCIELTSGCMNRVYLINGLNCWKDQPLLQRMPPRILKLCWMYSNFTLNKPSERQRNTALLIYKAQLREWAMIAGLLWSMKDQNRNPFRLIALLHLDQLLHHRFNPAEDQTWMKWWMSLLFAQWVILETQGNIIITN